MMNDLTQGSRCWYLNDTFERTSGTVAGHIVWRCETLVIIQTDESEDDADFVVRPRTLVAGSPDEALGFAMHDDALMANIADMVMTHRYL